MPLQATSGAASYDGFGGGVAAVPTYIEDVFSTYLYTGNGATQTITNGIDLSTKGGLVWLKNRTGTYDHWLWDTARGAGYTLRSNLTNAQANIGTTEGVSFTTSGFSMGNNINWNGSSLTATSWTFRKQPKFFDVVTYTGTGANRTISHSLGSVPGCIFVKRTDTTGDWQVYHRSLANTEYLVLNSANAQATSATRWNSTTPTSTVFSLGTDSTVNASGGTYVAYIFAHNAGGFGLTGTDNVISCGRATISGVTTVTLGYEPQLLIMKKLQAGNDWESYDNMRGLDNTNQTWLKPSTSDAESVISGTAYTKPTATGFTYDSAFGGSGDYIYIAIRRGPMKVPTSGTSVFSPNVEASTASPQTITTNFPVDLSINRLRTAGGNYVFDRLRGSSTTSFATLQTQSTAVEQTGTGSGFGFDNNTGIVDNGWWNSTSAVLWNFRRAPNFFDEVCYTGTGAAVDVNHNLKVKPELMLIKKRSSTGNWMFHHYKDNTAYRLLRLNETTASLGDFTGSDTNSTSFRAYLYTPDTGVANDNLSVSGATYVAYLFATCAGVSKVGSYTGNGSSQTINCGFTSGARFVLIKRTDSTGDWYVWDTARGIVTANDPHLSLNTTVAEVTTDDTIDTDSTGFIVNQLAATNVNVTSATYIFLAIA